MEIIAQAQNSLEMIECLNNGVIPELLLLSVNKPSELSDVEVVKFLQYNYPSIKTICIANELDKDAISTMVNHGIKGFINTSIDIESFFKIVNLVRDNGLYFEDNIIYNSSKNRISERRLQPLIHKLTERELQTAILMSTNKPYKEIASLLGISVNTLDNIRVRIFKKTASKTRIDVAILMLSAGLLNSLIQKIEK